MQDVAFFGDLKYFTKDELLTRWWMLDPMYANIEYVSVLHCIRRLGIIYRFSWRGRSRWALEGVDVHIYMNTVRLGR